MIHRFKTIDSTNTYAKELASKGAPHGTVVIADHQTDGRGRMGRSFHSPAGAGLYLSMILRPESDAQQLMHLTCAAAVAACNAIEEITGFSPGIKWTNDIVWQKRKLGGILTEIGFSSDKPDYAVIGIGINCNQAPGDFPAELQNMAASLSMVTGTPVDRMALEKALIHHLKEITDHILSNKSAILVQYRTNCITLGNEVSVIQGSDVFHAKAVDIDSDGGLIILCPDGKRQTVSTGEVSIRGMYGYV